VLAQLLKACRCFRNELRRVILALATRTASVLVTGFAFGGGAFFSFLPVGIMGCTGVGTFEARSTGCVLIGPVTGVSLGILDNSIWRASFEDPKKNPPARLQVCMKKAATVFTSVAALSLSV
jgi:hypothetical protein